MNVNGIVKTGLIMVFVILGKVTMAETPSFESILQLAEERGVFDVPAHPFLERPETNEAVNLKSITRSMFNIQMAKEPQSRDAHAKGHACLVGTLTVESIVPQQLQAGLFANEGKSYSTIVRYSNGSGVTKSDAIPDGRGIAVKVIDGAENGNLLDTGTNQDFMMIDSPRFFVRSIADYAFFQSVVENLKAGESPGQFFFVRALREALGDSGLVDGETYPAADFMKVAGAVASKDPKVVMQVLGEQFGANAGVVAQAIQAKMVALQSGQAPLELRIATELAKVPGSLTTIPYFSMSSYLAKSINGPANDTAVKYAIRPLDCSSGVSVLPQSTPPAPSENYLREDLLNTVSTKDICYGFYLQALPSGLGADKRIELVEDSRLDYGTSEVLVAKLRIPSQESASSAKQTYCENLSFNLWQADAALRPLGSMNRARKSAVTMSSMRRHSVTEAPRREPTSVDEFKQLK